MQVGPHPARAKPVTDSASVPGQRPVATPSDPTGLGQVREPGTTVVRHADPKTAGASAVDCLHGPGWGMVPFVSVLVLNWNGSRYLTPCLDSIERNRCRHVEIVLVDNGSTDGSVDLVSDRFPGVTIVAHSSNQGFSRGYNAAIGFTRGHFLVFLNNDTVVDSGWLVPLIDELVAHPGIGITMSKLLFIGSRTVNSAGGVLKLWTGGQDLG
jgi:cellulose synthase/poly-beta-1,6-N-acetylglucosamine synthase-like glycosyltransferase